MFWTIVGAILFVICLPVIIFFGVWLIAILLAGLALFGPMVAVASYGADPAWLWLYAAYAAYLVFWMKTVWDDNAWARNDAKEKAAAAKAEKVKARAGTTWIDRLGGGHDNPLFGAKHVPAPVMDRADRRID